MTLLAKAMRNDLQAGSAYWNALARNAQGLSPLRTLDIVAWSLNLPPDVSEPDTPEAVPTN